MSKPHPIRHHNVRVESRGRTYRVCFYGATREGAQAQGHPLIVALKSKLTNGRERVLNPDGRRARALIAAARKAT